MAGHSQFKNIMHKKGRADAARSKLFSKLAREVTVAAKMGLPDPEHNPRLRAAIIAARAENMPKDNIERAIKKGTGELEGVDYVEVLYEGFAPGGVALMIQALTDNATRTVADVRYALSRGGGNMGATNSVSWMFERKGQIYLDATRYEEDPTLEAALEAGATDFVREDDRYIVSTDVASFHAVKSALEQQGIVATESEVAWIPKQTVSVTGADAEAVLRLIETLDELDDVQKVDANFDIDASVMSGLNG
jgi:YebC/PmpR family DNA-binding regulatory protein